MTRKTNPQTNTLAMTKICSPFVLWRVGHAGIRLPGFDEPVSWEHNTLEFRLLRSVSVGELT